jgi:hypothetical protein
VSQRNIRTPEELDYDPQSPLFWAIGYGYRSFYRGFGEDLMKEFVIAVVAAVAVGVVSVYALDVYQKTSTSAYSSPSGVRL